MHGKTLPPSTVNPAGLQSMKDFLDHGGMSASVVRPVRLSEELDRLRDENARLRSAVSTREAELTALRAAEQKRNEQFRFEFRPSSARKLISAVATPSGALQSPFVSPLKSVTLGDCSPLAPKTTSGPGVPGCARADAQMPTTGDTSTALASRVPLLKKARIATTAEAMPIQGTASAPRVEAPLGVLTAPPPRALMNVSATKIPFGLPVTGIPKLTRTAPMRPNSPISVSSGSSEAPSSRATSPGSSVHAPPPFERLLVVPGFGPRSARYLVKIGQTKFANNAVELVSRQYALVLWPAELRRLLDITEEQARELVIAMRADILERGLVQ
ncbi:uncharacterized protein B0H18DRAFT_1124538 [Fomitopsis serialis]|uniref:uncharacterized protein n=1 Tax=Fomitopsis serialis TaxID=139415 RepID=UPI0020074EFE|nr:uncharacterized protein B0H18DRAFT_1124538 [Neoantrodia serialis]KAH9915995.1 hypothetical protein B0H18DRAFT_1124538 [Neoantrodia serialis]